MRRESRAIAATLVCFLAGSLAGTLLLWGGPRPVAGTGSFGVPAALVAAAVAAASFIVSTRLHRRGSNDRMPRWQVIVSATSAVALTIAFAGVTGLGVLLAGEVLGVGLQGLELPAIGGGVITGVASAVGGRLAFEAGVGLETTDLATLLFSYLVIGTLFAMLTSADPRWWEQNFSRLGSGDNAWAFNGTLVVAGVIAGTVGAYIARDLHRIHGDAWFGRIALVAGLWALTGIALAGVGLFPAEQLIAVHNVFAVGTLVLFVASGVATTAVMPGPPRALTWTTVGIALLLVLSFVLTDTFHLFTVTVLEAIAIGLGLLWLTTLVRILAVLVPDGARPSERHLLRPAEPAK